MRLANILPVEELETLAKVRKLAYEESSIANRDLATYESEGWAVTKRGPRRSKIRRNKTHDQLLEDRIWTVLHKMGFSHMSGDGGARLEQTDGTTDYLNQLDVVAIDEHVCFIVECKSRIESGRRATAQTELALLSQHISDSRQPVQRQFGKKKLGGIYAFSNGILSDEDIARAKNAKILLLDDASIQYYERLVEHTGPAAKYQLLADLFPLQDIPGLSQTVPAVETRIGNQTAYIFAIEPAHLLKIGYVAHRMRGELGTLGAYQRMVTKKRLKDIRAFINEGGVFPTNIVVNFDRENRAKSNVQFNRTKQEENNSDNVRMGWLKLPSKYQSAWIIDGQHRLLAFSGLERANTSTLCVTAFDGLSLDDQANMFIDINSEQKRVSGNLLIELVASLKWNSPDPDERIFAIVSTAIQDLAKRQGSPFYGRIKLNDELETPTRCITLQSIAKELTRGPFFVARRENQKPIEFGPFWRNDTQECLSRTKSLLDGWFGIIEEKAGDVWSLGKEAGGFLATNNGIVASIKVFESVLRHLDLVQTLRLSTDDLVSQIEPYAGAVAEYFKDLSLADVKNLRRKQGVQGQTEVMRIVQTSIKTKFPEFNPDGLEAWIANRADEREGEARDLVADMEKRIQAKVIEILKENFDETADAWWLAIPASVRVPASGLREQDNRRRSEESYLQLIDYRAILDGHWGILGDSFTLPSVGNSKAERTKWIVKLNDIRNKAMHASSGGLTQDEVEWLHEISSELASIGI